MALIFISYRRHDCSGHAGRIHDHLVRALRLEEEDTFLDVDSLEPGIDWSRVVAEKLSECVVLLVLIGERWSLERLAEPEDYVRQEILIALQRDMPIIPVLVDGAEMPTADQLPGELASLASRQAQRLDSHSNRAYLLDLEALIEAIRRLLTPVEIERLLSRKTILHIYRDDAGSFWNHDGGEGFLILGYGLPLATVFKGKSVDLVTTPGRLSFHVEFTYSWRTPHGGGLAKGRSEDWVGVLKPGKYRFQCGVEAGLWKWLPFTDTPLFLNLVDYTSWPSDVRELSPADLALVSREDGAEK